MSESDDGGPGTREVAYRLFAAEYDNADLEFSESDEERAPNYVVTPTGARVNRLFAVGVLTEIEQVNEDVLRARVVDPTGAFVVYAGQYQPDEMAALERMDPPAFVAVTGKANAFQPDDSDRVFTSIRPESINRVDDETRDRWAVATAERTLERLGTFADALDLDETGDDLEDALLARGVDPALAQGIPIALDHYGTTREYLGELWDVAVDATRVVAGEIDADEVGPLSLAPGEGGDEATVEFTVSQVDDEAAEPAETADESGEPTDEAPAEPASEGESAESAGEEEPAEPTDEEEPAEPAAAESGVDGGTVADAETARDAETTVEDSEDASEALGDWDDTDDVEPGQETVTDEEFEPEADEVEELGTGGAGDEMYEFDEEEREQIEEEYGTDFSTGTEVGEPGEADIDVGSEAQPASDETNGDAEEPRDSEPGEQADALEGTSDELPDDDLAEAAAEVGGGEAAEVEDEATEGEDEAADSGGEVDVDEDAELGETVMDVMEQLDEGDGAPREEIVAGVVDGTGADPADVEDAIEDALMGGQCYESGDDTLKPI